MLNNFRLNTNGQYMENAAKNVANSRGNDQRRKNLSNLLHGSRDNLESRENKLTSLNYKTSKLGDAANSFANVFSEQGSNGSTASLSEDNQYSDELQKLSSFYDTNPRLFTNQFNQNYCNDFKKIGSPIYINTLIKGKHFSLETANRVSEEIDFYLSSGIDSNTKNKLGWIKYALCNCTKDRHGKQCNTTGLETGGRRKKNKKTKRRKSMKKRRRTTRKR
jgi:hypothetical protein